MNQGSVKLSGTDVRDINTAGLRQMEALVTQDTHLFHDSIANNLRIAKPDATQAELEDACRKASVHDFILSLPKGYDTPGGRVGGHSVRRRAAAAGSGPGLSPRRAPAAAG